MEKFLEAGGTFKLRMSIDLNYASFRRLEGDFPGGRVGLGITYAKRNDEGSDVTFVDKTQIWCDNVVTLNALEQKISDVIEDLQAYELKDALALAK